MPLRFGLMASCSPFTIARWKASLKYLFELAYTVEPLRVRFVVREKRLAICLGIEVSLAELVVERQVLEAIGICVIGQEAHRPLTRRSFGNDRRCATMFGPSPDVAKPKVRKQVQRSRIRPAV